jgi:hypothetical protein
MAAWMHADSYAIVLSVGIVRPKRAPTPRHRRHLMLSISLVTIAVIVVIAVGVVWLVKAL